METVITIIIAIVFFAFQVYANFQKEQDKARKRNPAQPPLPPLPEDNAKYIQPVPADVPPTDRGGVPSAAAPSPYERYSGMIASTASMRNEQRKPLIPQRIAIETEADGQQSALGAGEFDLRDAVIKSIILHRPYQ